MWLHPVLSAYGHFNPLHPRRRRRLNQLAWGDNQADFNPLHPRRRRRCKSYGAGSATEISIHSTRGGGDANGPAYDDYMNQFQSTPPAKAETGNPAHFKIKRRFQSTPPAKAETAGAAKAVRGKENFNPLHPRRRRPMNLPPPGIGWRFQSTPPAKAETIAEPSEKLYSLISIHSTHEGGDDYPVLACN